MDSNVQTPSAGWSRDALAGFLVFLIALPLCLGIALASGFPPVAGVLSAIVGGVLATFLGSARLAIKGPAAGLIVIAIGAVADLGGGDVMLGYRRALAVGAIAAVLQILFAWRHVGGLGAAMPPSVVHGMLAAIGVIIVAKQAPLVAGVVPESTEPLELLLEMPGIFIRNNPEVLLIGASSLVVMAVWPLIVGAEWSRRLPAPLLVLLIAVPLGLYFDLDHAHDYALFGHLHHVGPELLINLPGTIVDAVVLPDFSAAFTLTSMKYVIMFALVGTIESTLSVVAVDSMDPERRVSDLDKDLFSVGLGNLVSASIGGMPMISEIVRSKANIDSGARSRLANFFHGLFLLIFVAMAPGLLHHIPLAALAAMLVFVGLRLSSPREVLHAREVGVDQLVLFMTTLLVTLAVDLLVGIAVGLILKVVLHRLRGATFAQLFQPRVEVERNGTTLSFVVDGAATFLAVPMTRKALSQLPDGVQRVQIDLRRTPVVDHTFLEHVDAMSKEWKNAELELLGLAELAPSSGHPHAFRRISA